MQGCGCGVCSGRKIAVGINDLATTHPECLNAWDFEKNTITPQDVTAGRSTKVWWTCDLGHSWEASIYNYVGNKQRCPVCAHQKIEPGFNDIFTVCPEAKIFFDEEKTDSSIDVTTLAMNSKTPLWWKCDKGHSWEESPRKRIRNRKPHGYPYCTNKRISQENNIMSLYPQIAHLWDEEKNGFPASQAFTGSIEKRHFMCDKGHSWMAQPNDMKKIVDDGRTIRCPQCFPQRVSRQELDVLDYVKDILGEADYHGMNQQYEDITEEIGFVDSHIALSQYGVFDTSQLEESLEDMKKIVALVTVPEDHQEQ